MSYYNPKIEELRVGFKCEIHDGEIWVPVILDVGSMLMWDTMIYRGQIRVKELDVDDFYAKGFKFEIGTIEDGFRLSKSNENGTGLIVVFYPKYNMINIQFYDTYSDLMATSNCWADQTLFSGKCKNISELEFFLSKINMDI